MNRPETRQPLAELFVSLLGLLALCAGCGETVPSACVPGEVASCRCDDGDSDDGADGRRICDDDGRFGACECVGPDALPAAFASAGTFCDASGELRDWLVITPGQQDCVDSTSALDLRDPVDSLSVRVPDRVLRTGLGSFTATARRCRQGTCDEYPAEIDLTRYDDGEGAAGTYRLTLADASVEAGSFEARWCDYARWAEHTPPDQLVRGLSVTEVSIYQAVKVPLMVDGALPDTLAAPVVAWRPGVMRIGVEAEDDWEQRAVRVRLTLRKPDGTLDTREFEADTFIAADDGDLESTFNYMLDGQDIAPGTEYTVELLETIPCFDADGDETGARWPARGRDTLGAVETAPLEVVLVPVAYAADGSNRVPRLDDALLADVQAQLQAYFPTAEVRVSQRAPVRFDEQVTPSCEPEDPLDPDGPLCGWNRLLDAMLELRLDDGAPPWVHYYGLVAPAASFNTFCGVGCTLGLGVETGPQDELFRVATGVGWSGTAEERTILLDTLTHELGHTHGRKHAPCGDPGGVDASFPYAAGNTGSWGYDLRDGSYYDPSHSDIMGYCESPWISDYNYDGLAQRLQALVDESANRPLDASAPAAQMLIAGGSAGRSARMLPMGSGDAMKGSEPAAAIDAKGAVIGHTQVRRLSVPDTASTLYLTPAPAQAWEALRLQDGTLVNLRPSQPPARLHPM